MQLARDAHDSDKKRGVAGAHDQGMHAPTSQPVRAASCHVLATGYWLLAAGCWLPGTMQVRVLPHHAFHAGCGCLAASHRT